MQIHRNLIRNGYFSLYRHSFSSSVVSLSNLLSSIWPPELTRSISHCRLFTDFETLHTSFFINTCFSIAFHILVSSFFFICSPVVVARLARDRHVQFKAWPKAKEQHCCITIDSKPWPSSFSLPPLDSLYIRPDGRDVNPKSTGATCCQAPDS